MQNFEPYKNPFWYFSCGLKKDSEEELYQKSGLTKLLCWSHGLHADQLFNLCIKWCVEKYIWNFSLMYFVLKCIFQFFSDLKPIFWKPFEKHQLIWELEIKKLQSLPSPKKVTLSKTIQSKIMVVELVRIARYENYLSGNFLFSG
jgi:hypothetical protein